MSSTTEIFLKKKKKKKRKKIFIRRFRNLEFVGFRDLGFVGFRDLGFIKFQFLIISLVSFCNYLLSFLSLKYKLYIKSIWQT